jgi:dTDP-4-amino-4,6-dideoxygalactose transaminase
MLIPLSNPDITEKEKSAVLQVLDSTYLALGPFLKKFEDSFSSYTGLKYALAVNSGTSALHIILRSMGFEKGHGMLTTPFTFVASANVAIYEQGDPVFIDIDPYNYNISIDKLNNFFEGKYRPPKSHIKTDFLMAVDVFSLPLDWDKIRIPGEIKVIEDSCEALGAEYKNKKIGTFGLAGAFAFYPNKQITTGEGGMIVTDDEGIYKAVKSMSNQGRGESGAWLEHVRLGYNYRMDEMSAALGYSQMTRLDEILAKRKSAADRYRKLFEGNRFFICPSVPDYVTRESWFVYVVRINIAWISNLLGFPNWISTYQMPDIIEHKNREEWHTYLKKAHTVLDSLLEKLLKKGVQARNYFSPVHLQKFYKDLYGYEEGDFPYTELTSCLTVAIPFFSNITAEQQEYVVKSITESALEIENEIHG